MRPSTISRTTAAAGVRFRAFREDAAASCALVSIIAGCILFLSGGSACAADALPVIVAFGDSLTAGYGADPGRSYPDDLQRDLDKLGYAYRVENLGISGETTADGLARIATVIACKPRIVILEFGGNDGLRGIPIDAARANLDQMMARLRAAHVRILLAGLTLPPNYGPDYIRPFQAMYHDLGGKYHVPVIPFLLVGVFERHLFQADGIHPTAEGYALVAQTVLRYLEPMLGLPPRPKKG